MKKSFCFIAALLLPIALGAQTGTSSAQTTSTTAPAKKATTAAKASAPAAPAVTLPTEPGVYAVFYTSFGNIVCRLFPEDAPKAVANFRGLATGTKEWTDPVSHAKKKTPLYAGTIFHRVIPNFMIQGGDPSGTGMGMPVAGFGVENSPKHDFSRPGLLAMANTGRPNSNGSQFFITVAPYPSLNGGYTIFGEVVSGQEVADSISRVPRNENDGDKPYTPVKLNRVAIRTVPAPGAPSKSTTAAPAKAATKATTN
jgi:peptidyl-prolyl cis-trans isomerase A (cyclophilin A)